MSTRWLRWIFDVGLCAALIGLGLLTTLRSGNGEGDATTIDSLVMPAAILPVLLRWRAPRLAAGLFAVGVVVSGIPTFAQVRCGFAIPAGLLILYVVASQIELREALQGLALVLAGLTMLFFTDLVLIADPVGAALFVFPLSALVWVMGRVVWSRDRVADELAKRTQQLTRQREQTAQLAVEVERTRLASDLNAVVRGGVCEMIELAEQGERVVAVRAQDTAPLFALVERQGRECLNEMRGLLGVLRSDQRAGRAPRPTLVEIEPLLEEARAGGRLVDLQVQGERRPLPGGVELGAYRALEHALVTVSAADGNLASVQLRYAADTFDLEVRGVPSESIAADAALAAARERVTAHGGSFSSGVRSHGLRVLRAHWPVLADDG